MDLSFPVHCLDIGLLSLANVIERHVSHCIDSASARKYNYGCMHILVMKSLCTLSLSLLRTFPFNSKVYT